MIQKLEKLEITYLTLLVWLKETDCNTKITEIEIR